jgi:two-component system response regulator AtoC
MLPTVDVRVLIAEDDEMVAGMLQRYLEGRGHRVDRCANGRDALRAIRDFAFDVALLDIEMPEMDGLEVLRQAREDPFPPECVIITGHSTIDTAVSAMRFGAFDYLAKPYRLEEIDILIRRAAEKRRMSFDNVRMRRRLFRLEAPQAPQSEALSMQAALQAAERAAQSLSSVMVVGEPGTGKSTIARYLHHVSPRSEGPLVSVNCDLLDPQRSAAALFSTTSERPESGVEDPIRTVGALEEAAGGTVVFCDVEWLDDPTQALLAESLASGYYRRQGSKARLAVECRAIATTITAMGDHHEIRTDLLQQLSGEIIALPPLRARDADIIPIAERYVREAAPRAPHALTDDAKQALLAYHWPGNLKELRAVMSRAVTIATGETIDMKHLLLPLHVDVVAAPAEDESLEAMERRHVLAVLARVGGHQGRAAERLGISSKTLYRKIREYGVARDDSPGSV